MSRKKAVIGWFEEYRCGCVSETVRYKKDLIGYCGKHGDSRRQVFPELSDQALKQMREENEKP